MKFINWRSVFALILLPLASLVASFFYFREFGFSWPLIGLTIFFYYATGLSITAGYHRLFSHKTYEANRFVQFLYLFFGAGAFQDSALTWCTDHRYHHKYTDTPKDPYNAKRGFWFSHIGWMLSLQSPVEERMAKALTKDLRSNTMVMFQHRYYVFIAVFAGWIFPGLIAWTFGAPFGGFLIAGLVRMFFVHQYTFFINSLSHMWGRETYGSANTAKDNAFISLFTYGEGYHNFHHHFQNDYRNGVRWYDFDPTKWLIRFTAFVGLAKKLKRTADHEILLARVQQQLKNIEKKGDLLQIPLRDKVEAVRQSIDFAAHKLKSLQEELQNLRGSLQNRKNQSIEILNSEIKVAKQELYLRYKHLKYLVEHFEKSAVYQ